MPSTNIDLSNVHSCAGACIIKLVLTVIYGVFVSGKPFQPRLGFVGKAERYFTRIGSGLTHQH
jgi:hypothetical protein